MSDGVDDRDMLAAEYVLGTLDAASAADVAARAQVDPTLQAAIAVWQERLAALSLLTTPVMPPKALWVRLAASTGVQVFPKRRGVLGQGWRSLAVWRFAAASGFAVAAALVGFIVFRTPGRSDSVAALVPLGSAAAVFLAELEQNGSLHLVALQPISVAQGKDLELWALPAGATRPIPLGLLPPSGRYVAPADLPAVQTQLLVSLEPLGGSPTGLPTGPVLFTGTLHGAD